MSGVTNKLVKEYIDMKIILITQNMTVLYLRGAVFFCIDFNYSKQEYDHFKVTLRWQILFIQIKIMKAEF